MATRGPASERTREESRALIDGGPAGGDERSALRRLATRLIVEGALEAAVEDASGRGYHEHGAAAGAGCRNGDRTGRLRTAEGPIACAAPQAAAGTGRLFARGLSTRDIADVVSDAAGRPLLGRAAGSRPGERLRAEYRACAGRDLAEHDIGDPVVGGIAGRPRPGQPRGPVLAAWGIGRDGRKVRRHPMAGSREATRRCAPPPRTCAPAAWASPCRSSSPPARPG